MSGEMRSAAPIHSYRDLEVWRKSMALVETVYRHTGKLPAGEQWGLTAQLRRAAVSVPSNIAEGYGRQATGEYRHHLSMARGSLLEVETQMLICQRLGCLSPEETSGCMDEIDQISRMLSTLVAKLR